MKYMRIGISFLLVTLLVLFSCSENPEQKRDKHMERGDSYYEKQEYKKAIIEYKNVIQADPKFARGHYQLALSYLKTSQPRKAFGELTRTVDLDPNNMDAQLKMGQFYLLGRKTEEAREKLEEAAEAVDVSTLISDRVLDQGALLLRAQPVTTVQEADFEIETRINQYGIEAHSWDSQASFFVDAQVSLLDSGSGRIIWKAKVQAKDPIIPGGWGVALGAGNIITAQALASLSVEEIQLALESLADYSAEAILEELADGLERARRR